MKRTNKMASAAMKLAHKIKNQFSTFAQALKSAWAQIKSGAKKMKSEKLELTEKTPSGLEVYISIQCSLDDDTAYADGWNVNLGKSQYNDFRVILKKDNRVVADTWQMPFVYRLDPRFDKQMSEKGAIGRVGNSYLGQESWDVVERLMDQVKKHIADFADQNGETAKKQAKTAAAKKYAEMESADIANKKENGYCFACESYCHGDCGNYSNNPDVRHIREITDYQREQSFGIND